MLLLSLTLTLSSLLFPREGTTQVLFPEGIHGYTVVNVWGWPVEFLKDAPRGTGVEVPGTDDLFIFSNFLFNWSLQLIAVLLAYTLYLAGRLFWRAARNVLY